MDDFFEGPTMQTISGPLVGGGVAQLGILGTRKFLPAQAKWAGLIGAALGVGASLLLKRKDYDKGVAGIAVALLVGIPRQIEDLMLPSKLSGADTDLLGAYTSEMGDFGAYTSEMGEASPVQVLNSGSGGTGVIGAVVPEESMAGDLGADIEIQDAGAFGSTGF